MNYCVRFSRKFEYTDEIAEFKIIYKPRDKKLLEFLDYFNDKRFIISITVDDMPELVLSNLWKDYAERKNFTFLLPEINDDNRKIISLFIKELKSNNIPFYFEDKVYSIDKVWELIDLGVSDIYISGELGFELAEISDRIHEAGVKIRVFPDVAQSVRAGGDSVTKFFIRPEDVDNYEDFVDVMEFTLNDKERDNILYKIYAINKKWTHEIKDIILNFDDEISNLSFPSSFGEVRTHCRKRCLKNGNCQICFRAKELSNYLNSKEIHLKTDNEL